MENTVDRWVTIPIEQVLEECQYILSYNANNEIIAKTIENILSVTTVRSNIDDNDLQKVANIIRNFGVLHPIVCSLLLKHLSNFPNPIPFVHIIPTIFSSKSESLRCDVVSQLQDLLSTDNRYCLPVLSALVELSLPSNSHTFLNSLCENAIGIVDETDLPFLFRTILKNSEFTNCRRIIKRLRDELKSVSISTISMIVEAMWEMFSSSSYISNVFIDQIILDINYKNIELLDVAASIIAYSGMTQTKSHAMKLFSLWMEYNIFPYNHIEDIIKMKSSNEVWNRMIHPIMTLVMWLISQISYYDASMLTSPRTQLDGLKELYAYIYDSVPDSREKMVHTLLAHCFDGNSINSDNLTSNSSLHQTAAGSRNLSPMEKFDFLRFPTVQEYFSNHISNTNSTSRNSSNHIKDQSTSLLSEEVSIHLLDSIIRRHSSVASVVFSTITDRVLSTSNSEGNVSLPRPYLLHKLLQAICLTASSNKSFENSMFIIVQKVLGSSTHQNITSDDISLVTRIFSNCEGNQKHFEGNQYHDRNPMNKSADNIWNIDNHFYYSSMSVAFMIACHMLCTHIASNQNDGDLCNQDVLALLTWIIRSAPSYPSTNLLYALDTIVSSIQSILSRRNDKSNWTGVAYLIDGFLDKLLLSNSNILSKHNGLNSALSSPNSSISYILRTQTIDNKDSECDFATSNTTYYWKLDGISKSVAILLSDPSIADNTNCKHIAIDTNAVLWTVERFAALHGLNQNLNSFNSIVNRVIIHISDNSALHLLSNENSTSEQIGMLPVMEYVALTPSCFLKYQSELNLSSSITSPVVALRLVWEAALLSCVVYGYLESNNLLIDEQYRSQEREYSSDYICYLLHTISCCRYYLRYTSALLKTNCGQKSVKKSTNDNSKLDKVIGGKRKYKNSSNSKKIESKISRQHEIYFLKKCYTQISEISNYMDMIVLNIPLKSLIDVIDMNEVHATSHTFKPFSNYDLCSILCLTARINESSPHRHIENSPFVPGSAHSREDIANCKVDSSTTSSSDNYHTASRLDRAEKSSVNVDIETAKVFMRMLGSSLHIHEISEQLRKANEKPASDNFDTETQHIRQPLDYIGSSLLLVNIYISSFSIIEECMKEFCRNDDSRCHTDKVPVESNTAKLYALLGNVNSDNFQYAERVEIIRRTYLSIEKQVVTTHNAVVALAGVKLLCKLSITSALKSRVCSVLWNLICNVHDYDPNSLFPLAFSNNENSSSKHTKNGMIGEGLGISYRHIHHFVMNISHKLYIDDNENISKSKLTKQLFHNSLFHSFSSANLNNLSSRGSNKIHVNSEYELFDTFRLLWVLLIKMLPWKNVLYLLNIIILEIYIHCGIQTNTHDILLLHSVVDTTSTKRNNKQMNNINEKKYPYVKIYDLSVNRITDINFGPYLMFCMSIFPTTLSNIKLESHDLDISNNSVGPYDAVIDALKVLFWMSHAYFYLDKHNSKWFTENSLNFIKICQSSISAMEDILNVCINWRNSQPQNADKLECDFGSLSYLTEVFIWIEANAQAIDMHTMLLMSKMVTGKTKIKFPSGLQLAGPKLRSVAKRFLDKLATISLNNNITFTYSSTCYAHVLETRHDWMNNLHKESIKFGEYQKEIIRKSDPSVDCWEEDLQTCNTNVDKFNDFHKGVSTNKYENVDDISSIRGFGVNAKRSQSGWGLYGESLNATTNVPSSDNSANSSFIGSTSSVNSNYFKYQDDEICGDYLSDISCSDIE